MKFGIYFINNFTQMVLVIRKVIMIGFNYEQFTQIIGFYPCLISFVKSFKVVDPYRAFIFSSLVWIWFTSVGTDALR